MQNLSSTQQAQAIVPYSALVGKALEEARTQRKLTQAQAAQALQVSQSSYSRMESGATAISVSQLVALAQAFGLEPNALIQRADTYAKMLSNAGVQVPNQPETNKAALLVGLGILLMLLAASGE